MAHNWEECDEEPIAIFEPRGGAEVDIGPLLAIGGCNIRTLGTLGGTEEEDCIPVGEGEPGFCVCLVVVPEHEL